jgi:hypothetical protein
MATVVTGHATLQGFSKSNGNRFLIALEFADPATRSICCYHSLATAK